MSLIRKGDKVVVVTGPYKDRALPREVLAVYPKENRLLVEGVNLRVRHEKVRPNQDGTQSGGIVEREAPIHVSNVLFFHKGKGVRLGSKVKDDGTKVRVVRGRGDNAGDEVE